ncbi:hypothetical protein PIB30_019085 [Stylosanthes scabra]|uniref:Uncharacterized protein n=1 Tax=Stylosanthes scabra TaxID=79078 RepID=A0ABU6UBB3_9FABA|nr:hypothetical protein [Stylosanthes scabra]
MYSPSSSNSFVERRAPLMSDASNDEFEGKEHIKKHYDDDVREVSKRERERDAVWGASSAAVARRDRHREAAIPPLFPSLALPPSPSTREASSPSSSRLRKTPLVVVVVLKRGWGRSSLSPSSSYFLSPPPPKPPVLSVGCFYISVHVFYLCRVLYLRILVVVGVEDYGGD